MKKVYLIRHGLPDFPSGKRMCLGITDLPMGAEGLMQAAQMAQKLPAVTAVFSSPLTRAIQTAQAIGMPITILEGLREVATGDWDGLTFDEIKLRWPELYAARGTDTTCPLPGAEPNDSALSRFSQAMTQAAASAQGDLAVVSHAGVIGLFLQSISDWYKPDYAEIVVLNWNNGAFFLQDLDAR